MKLFSAFGKIEAVKYLAKGSKKGMCLIKFSALSESFEAMASLHGKELDGRKMFISFTRSKI